MRGVARRSLRAAGVAVFAAALLLGTVGVTAAYAEASIDLSGVSSGELAATLTAGGLTTVDTGEQVNVSFIGQPGTTLTVNGVPGIQAFTFGSAAEANAALMGLSPIGGTLDVPADSAVFINGNTLFVVPNASLRSDLLTQLEAALGPMAFRTALDGSFAPVLDPARAASFGVFLSMLDLAGLDATVTGNVSREAFTGDAGFELMLNGQSLGAFVFPGDTDATAAIDLIRTGQVNLGADATVFRRDGIVLVGRELDASLQAAINAALGGEALVNLVPPPAIDVSGIQAALAAQGAVTTPTTVTVTELFIPTPGIRLIVNGANVEVFELGTAADVDAALNAAILPADTSAFVSGNRIIILRGVSQQPTAEMVLSEAFGAPIVTTVPGAPTGPGAPGAPAPAATGHGVLAGQPAGGALAMVLALVALAATLAGGRVLASTHRPVR
jgi:hypothetical protein